MTLIIEDGTGKPDATSYATVIEARQYALARGITLPADDPEVEVLLIKAMDYIEAQASRFTGHPTASTQALSWPRRCARINNQNYPDDEIPQKLIYAQQAAAIEVFQGADLMPTSDGRIVKRRKTDVLETEYAVGNDFRSVEGVPGPSFPRVDALLDPLFGRSVATLLTRRV